MELNWHEPTTFSRLLAIILFVGVIPTLSFYIGTQYQDMRSTKDDMVVYEFPRLTSYTATAVTPLEATSTP